MSRNNVLNPFPQVEEVRRGLWSIPVPLPLSSLRYVLVYVFESSSGPYLVDAGWNTDEAFGALCGGLEKIGTSIADVQGILITHIHPDHYGLAGRIRENSGAWIALHPADAALITDRYTEPDSLLKQVDALLRRMGVPEDDLEYLKNASMPVRQFVSDVYPDFVIEDEERPNVPGWDLTALWTPGHSPGHLCFWEGRNELLLSGDHVLPRITPNVSLHPQSGNDPLGDFLRSLDRLKIFRPSEVLPAHEFRFNNLGDRIDEIVAHHANRLVEIIGLISEGATTAWTIASRLKWSRRWEEFDAFNRRVASSEVLAHLHYLDLRGLVREVPGEPSHFEIV